MAIAPISHRKLLLGAILVAGLVFMAALGWLALRDQPLRLPAWLGGEPAAVAGPIPARTPIPGGHLPLKAPCFGEHALANRDYATAYQSFLSRGDC